MADIQWYPGHMKKAGRMMEESLSLVDVVCEVADARIPRSSRNPDLERIIAGRRPRLLLLNRVDQADPRWTGLWCSGYGQRNLPVVPCSGRTGKGVRDIVPAVEKLCARQGPVRAMVAGIPNVGKSTLINQLAGRRVTAVSDRPGVTRGKQWIRVSSRLELLDTPGILWPRFNDPLVGEHLAFTGAVKEEILDEEQLAARLLECLRKLYPQALAERYGLDPQRDEPGWQMLEQCARRRGFLQTGGTVHTERMAAVLLDEFRGGKLGRITLERPT